MLACISPKPSFCEDLFSHGFLQVDQPSSPLEFGVVSHFTFKAHALHALQVNILRDVNIFENSLAYFMCKIDYIKELKTIIQMRD